MQRLFFATANDLLPVFKSVEGKRSLTYTQTGLLESPRLTSAARGADIPTLRARATNPNAAGCESYLVMPSDMCVRIRSVPQYKGGRRHAVDQLENFDSITFSPGGFFSPEILLNGGIGNVSDSVVAKAIYRLFANAIAKEFVRIKAFWTGPEAAELLRKGCRLTGGANSPTEYDLVP